MLTVTLHWPPIEYKTGEKRQNSPDRVSAHTGDIFFAALKLIRGAKSRKSIIGVPPHCGFSSQCDLQPSGFLPPPPFFFDTGEYGTCRSVKITSPCSVGKHGLEKSHRCLVQLQSWENGATRPQAPEHRARVRAAAAAAVVRALCQ